MKHRHSASGRSRTEKSGRRDSVNNRYVGLAMALVVMVVSQGAAGQQPDAAGTVGGCPAEPLAFHTCALAKAKTVNAPRTSSGKPNLQGYFSRHLDHTF